MICSPSEKRFGFDEQFVFRKSAHGHPRKVSGFDFAGPAGRIK